MGIARAWTSATAFGASVISVAVTKSGRELHCCVGTAGMRAHRTVLCNFGGVFQCGTAGGGVVSTLRNAFYVRPRLAFALFVPLSDETCEGDVSAMYRHG